MKKMKKNIKIFTVISALLVLFTLTGCTAAANIREALSGPKDTWYRKEMTYTNKSGQSTEVVVFMCYSDNGYTATDLRSDVTLGSGLTVVVIAKDQTLSSNPVIGDLVTGKYLIKTFSDRETTVVDSGTDDESTESKSIKMDTTKWNLIYNSVAMEKQNGTINPLQRDSAWVKLEKPTSFSWKKIMANYLLDRLLEN